MAKDILLDTSVIVAHLRGKIDIRTLAPLDAPQKKGVRESAGINRLGIRNERVRQRRPSQ